MTAKQSQAAVTTTEAAALQADGAPIFINGRRAVLVPLQGPIKRAGGDIAQLHLLKPRTGDLRGLSLSELLVCQADAVATLLPRITVPTLLKPDMDELDPADLVAMSAEVVDFLTPLAARGYPATA